MHRHIRPTDLQYERKENQQQPLNRTRVFNSYLVGYNACRHIVWGHYVLREGERKKVYMKMRAGPQSQCSHLTWRGLGGWWWEGGSAGTVEQRLALLCPIVRPQDEADTETREPCGLTEDPLLPHQHSQ